MRNNVNLKPELSNIKDKVDELLMKIDADVITRKVFHGGIAVEAKSRRVPKLLETECLRLVDDYHAKRQVEEIKQFIQAERVRVTTTFKKHSFPHDHYDEFDRRINNLLELLPSRATFARRQSRKVPGWVSTVVATIIAGLILAMLTPWAMELVKQ